MQPPVGSQARFVESLSMQFVQYISRTVQPCLHPLAIPTASLLAATNRTPTRLSVERARRSGRGNLPFLLLVRAAAIATTWDARAHSRLRLLRLAQVVTVSTRHALARGASRSRGRIRSLSSLSAYARNWWSIRTSGAGRPPPIARSVKVTRSRT